MSEGNRARTLTLAATALGSALAFLDTTVVIVALPRMESDLGLGLSGQQWVVLGYALALSALYLPGGAVGDRLGLRRTFVVGVVLFGAASVLCAAAGSEATLVTGRALQGVGGAALTTTSLALLRVVWEGEAGRAIGLWTSFTSLATIGGPPLGGLIVESVGWRWVFLVNVPLGVVAIALALAGRSEHERSERRSTLDPVGAALAAGGLAGVTFALVELRERGAADVALPGIAGAVALAALAAWTLRAREPLVPRDLLARPGLVPANLVTLVLYAALSAQLLFWPLYLQFLGFSPLVSGLAFTLPSAGLVLLGARFGRIADRRGPRLPIAGGALLLGLALVPLLAVDERADAWTWGVAAMVLYAIGLPAVVAPITAAALAPAPARLSGVASGLNQTVARIGGVLSVAAVGALAGAIYVRAGGTAATPFDPSATGVSRDAAVEAFRWVVVSIVGLSLTAAALAAALLDDRPAAPRGSTPPAAAAAP